MTRMVPIDDREPEGYDDEPRRSIFSTLWFRALIVILILGGVAAVAVPYVLDLVSEPTRARVAEQPAVPFSPTVERAAPTAPPGASQAPGEPAPAAPPPMAPPESALSKPGEMAKPAAPPTARRSTATVETTTGLRETGGPYWIQVGAFRDQAAARRLADKLRSDNYTVAESATTADGGSAPASAPALAASDRYNVFVSGLPPAELRARLEAKGLGSEPVAGGVVLTPSLPLREAVALSRDLAGDGLQVQVRRASGPTTSPAAGPAATAPDDVTLYRVRVGSFPDRAAAQATLRELEAKGYKAFLTRSGP
jgi:cell division septation protein DedD